MAVVVEVAEVATDARAEAPDNVFKELMVVQKFVMRINDDGK